MKVLDRGRLHIASISVGVAERLIQDSLRYARERVQFGKPIAEFQLVQAMLADSRTEAYAARCMVLDAARRRDAGENVSADSSCCKLFATEMAGRVADRAVQIHGGAGYVADYGVERFYRDVRLFRLYEGTSQNSADRHRPRDAGGSELISGPFEHGRHPLAASDAHRLESITTLPPLQFVEHGRHDPNAGRGDRMA